MPQSTHAVWQQSDIRDNVITVGKQHIVLENNRWLIQRGQQQPIIIDTTQK
jgi:hypothetical protein